MENKYINPQYYDEIISEEGGYYPIIISIDEEIKKYFMFMPIKDYNKEYDIGMADSFEEAYSISQKYLNEYKRKYNKYPKHVNPYNIIIEEDEVLVMVKYN